MSHGANLLGFTESMGGPVGGALNLSENELSFHPAQEQPTRWPILDLRSVLASSSALQFASRDAQLWQFSFENDSAFRWGRLLERVVRRAWRGAGRGEVVELRPRITTR